MGVEGHQCKRATRVTHTHTRVFGFSSYPFYNYA